MKRLNVLNVLEQLINESYFHCEWAIEWQEQNHNIELSFQMELENPNQKIFWKDNKTYSQNKEIVFIMSVLIYDSKANSYSNDCHSILIPFDFDQGVEYGECLSLVKYLKVLTSTVPVKWREFMESNQAHSFTVDWNWNDYNKIKNRLIDSKQYSHTLVYFPN
ncbi:DUF3013 family protein [Aerococcaceae bacterium WGS1372]